MIAHYRTRWLESTGMCIVEKEKKTQLLWFFTRSEWIAVKYFPSRAEATAWIIDLAPTRVA